MQMFNTCTPKCKTFVRVETVEINQAFIMVERVEAVGTAQSG